MTTVREIGPDDWRAFRSIRLAALAESPAAFASTLADAERRTDFEWQDMVRIRCTSDTSAIWLAESVDGDTVDALGVVAVDCDLATGHTELVSMWVAPAGRGTGLGRLLIDAVIAWATASGSAAVSLSVMRGNEPAQRLYDSAGFVVTGDHHALPCEPCKDEIRMIRSVSPGV